MAGLRERGKPAWTRSAATTASPFGQGQGQGHGQGHGHEKTARPQADGRLQGKTSLSTAQENLHPPSPPQPKGQVHSRVVRKPFTAPVEVDLRGWKVILKRAPRISGDKIFACQKPTGLS